jgi:AraC family transcriptional regulator
MSASTFNSYRNWLKSTVASQAAEYRSVGSTPLHLTRVSLNRCFPDPPTPDWSIQLNLGKPIRMKCDFGHGAFEQTLPTGGFGLLPAETACNIDASIGDYQFLVLSLPYRLVQEFVDGIGMKTTLQNERLYRSFHKDVLIADLCQRLWKEAGNESNLTNLFAQHAFNTLMTLVLKKVDDSTTSKLAVRGKLSQRQLAKVSEYISSNLASAINLESLAKSVHLSPFHFSRLFRATTGLSPHQYVILERVNRSKTLIADGEFELACIATAVGFANQSHLTRHFKQIVGCTPAQFRRNGS